jgi:hypothetical protein
MPTSGSCVEVDLISHRIRLFNCCDSPILTSPWDAPDKGSCTSGGAAEDTSCTGASPVWTGTSNPGGVFQQWSSTCGPELIVVEVALDSPISRPADTVSFVSCDSPYPISSWDALEESSCNSGCLAEDESCPGSSPV